VLLKERNMLQSEKLRARAAGAQLQNPFRLTKVRPRQLCIRFPGMRLPTALHDHESRAQAPCLRSRTVDMCSGLTLGCPLVPERPHSSILRQAAQVVLQALDTQLPGGFAQVRKSMSRIKHVLNERVIVETDPEKAKALKYVIDAI